MRRFLVIIAISLFLFNSSDVFATEGQKSKRTGKISGVARDKFTRQPLVSVNISIIDTDGTLYLVPIEIKLRVLHRFSASKTSTEALGSGDSRRKSLDRCKT